MSGSLPAPAEFDPSRVHVIIVGVGFSGLALAIRLKQANIDDFTILERGDEIGGTWRDNHYPGAVCDIQSRLYSYSFEPSSRWTRSFAPQSEIIDYLKACAEKHRVRAHIQFNTRVESARFEEATSTWEVVSSDGRTFRTRVLVSACGGLVEPDYPDIPGLDRFEGPAFHTARFRHDVSLVGKEVAVIGTGASAVQVVPAVAPIVGGLHVFQRSPPWILPKPDRASPARTGDAPLFQRLDRWLLYWRKEVLATGFIIDQRILKLVQRKALRHLRRSVPCPALRARLTPEYAIGCKRILLSNEYYPALLRDNVDLVTDEIREIRARSIVTQDGRSRTVDVIVAATGFIWTEASVSFAVTGRAGRTLREEWSGGARAYLGTAVAGFPNLFLLLGPNTWVGHTSMVLMIEGQAQYILEAIKMIRARSLQSVEVRRDVQDAFNRRLHRRLERTVWSPGSAGWCRRKSRKSTARWPGYTFEFQLRTRCFRVRAYHLVAANGGGSSIAE